MYSKSINLLLVLVFYCLLLSLSFSIGKPKDGQKLTKNSKKIELLFLSTNINTNDKSMIAVEESFNQIRKNVKPTIQTKYETMYGTKEINEDEEEIEEILELYEKEISFEKENDDDETKSVLSEVLTILNDDDDEDSLEEVIEELEFDERWEKERQEHYRKVEEYYRQLNQYDELNQYSKDKDKNKNELNRTSTKRQNEKSHR